jgi:cobalt-zinc-cadmium efflux system outer membrane protein
MDHTASGLPLGVRRRHGPRASLRPAELLALLVLVAPPHPGAAQVELSLADPALTRALTEHVARHSPEVAARRAALEAARARVDAAGFASPAVLSGEMEDVPDGYRVADAGFRLEVGREFMTGGRRVAARALAAADARVAEAELAATEQQITARTIEHIARVTVATRVARRLAVEDSLLLGAEAAVRDRFSVGEARYVDVLRLRTERLHVQTERAVALAEGRAAREVLLGLAGGEGAPGAEALVDSVLALPVALGDDVPAPPSVDSLLARSGRLQAAAGRVDRAQASRDLAAADQRVRFSGSLGAQRRFEGGETSFGPVLGASITLPFTAGPANRARAAAAELESRAAVAERQAERADVTAALAAALARYEAARERVMAFDTALLQGARDEREGALGAYRTGEMSLVELLDFERALARAEIERLKARADVAEAYANLIGAANGG